MSEFSASIIVGELIPLTLQLDDGQDGLYPRVVITDDQGMGVDVVPLNDMGTGLYTNNSTVPMPDAPWVVAQFIVYLDPLYQNIATNYSIEIERFDTVNPDDFKGEFVDVNIGELVVGSVIEGDSVSGTIREEDKISAIIEPIEEAKGAVVDDSIETKVTDNSIVEGEI